MSTNKLNYNNPSALSLMAKMIKLSNKDIINDFVEDNNLSDTKTNNIKREYLKINHYYPTVIQNKNKEYLQCIGLT